MVRLHIWSEHVFEKRLKYFELKNCENVFKHVLTTFEKMIRPKKFVNQNIFEFFQICFD